MKVVLLNGSPNENGCTYTALSEVAKTLEENNVETEILQIGKEPVRGCIACMGCKKAGKCVFDDMANEYVKKVTESDGFIVGSPVYYASANGSLISLLDRIFYSSGDKFEFKPGAVVASARRAGTTATIDELNKYFGIKQMPLISSSYWNMVHGNTPEEVMQDEEGLQVMRNLARNMAWILKCIENGKKDGINLPENESGARTNFIR